MDEWLVDADRFVSVHAPEVVALALFVLGLAAGSFLNVVICRLPYRLSLVWPPSSCPGCGQRIALRHNVPLLGWLVLRGRCARCGKPISARYPLVELANGLLWGAAGYLRAVQAAAPGGDFGRADNAVALFLMLLFASLMLAIALIDLDHQIVPDELSLGGLGFFLALSVAAPAWWLHISPATRAWAPSAPDWMVSLLTAGAGALVGGGFVFLLSFLSTLAFRGMIRRAREEDPEIDSAIGLGDVKLMACVGAFLGWQGALASFALGTVLGAVAGIILRHRTGEPHPDKSGPAQWWHRWRHGSAVMAFGPWLALGALGILYFRAPVLGFFAALLAPPATAPL